VFSVRKEMNFMLQGCISVFKCGGAMGGLVEGRESSVRTATRYGLGGPEIESRWRRDFPQTGPGAHPASYTIGTGSFPGVQRPGRGVNHPTHLAPKLKKE
jgi:hypothetical protein